MLSGPLRSGHPTGATRACLALLAVLAGSHATSARAGTPAPFAIDVVQDSQFAGISKIVIDAEGRTHLVAFVSDPDYDILYAVQNGLSWTIETADSTGFLGFTTDIALDADGTPHLVYVETDLANYDIRYAVRSGGTWTSEPVMSNAWPGGIAIGPDGVPRVLYFRDPANEIGVATRTGGGWTTEDTGETGSVETRGIAIDDIGRIHIVFANNAALQYRVRDDDGWGGELVTSSVGGLDNQQLALDDQGHPSVLFRDLNGSGELRLAQRSLGAWVVGGVITTGFHTGLTLAIDDGGDPHIAFELGDDFDLIYGVRRDGSWLLQNVDAVSLTGSFASIALDSYGNPRIAYNNYSATSILHASTSIVLGAPLGGETWTVGDTESVIWRGDGIVDVEISADGGATFQTLVDDVSGTSLPNGTREVELLVPNLPSAFGIVRVVREGPRSVAQSGLVRVETNIALLRLVAGPASSGHGNMIEWTTDPGPDALAGYRLDRSVSGGWTTIAPFLEVVSFHDRAGRAGDRYRLFAINGLGQERLVGETTANGPLTTVLASPQPYRAGDLRIVFPTTGGLGGGDAGVTVRIFDVAGRLTRELLRTRLPAGVHEVTWDGQTDAGVRTDSGAYFLEVTSGAERLTRRVVVLR